MYFSSQDWQPQAFVSEQAFPELGSLSNDMVARLVSSHPPTKVAEDDPRLDSIENSHNDPKCFLAGYIVWVTASQTTVDGSCSEMVNRDYAEVRFSSGSHKPHRYIQQLADRTETEVMESYLKDE